MSSHRVKFLVSCLIFLMLVISTIFSINIFHDIEIKHEVVKDIYAAVVSIVLGSIVTLSLLYAQSLHEEKRNKGSEIFKQKITTFNEFIDSLGDYLQDGDLDQREIRLILLKRSKVLMHLSSKNRIIFDNAINRINYEIFFYDEWGNPDYEKLNELFEEIKRAFVLELYGSKGVESEYRFEVSNFLQFSKFKIDHPKVIDDIDEFIDEINKGRKVLFSVSAKRENEPNKFYSFMLGQEIKEVISYAHSYVVEIIRDCNVDFEVEYSINEKKIDGDTYILNPKINFIIKDYKAMILGVTNRNRVSLFIYNEKGERVKRLTIGDVGEGDINTNSIAKFLPKSTIMRFITGLKE